MSGRAPALPLVIVALLGTAGCTAAYQRETEADLTSAARGLDPLPEPGQRHPASELDGSLEGYVAAAMRLSPGLRAAFERWQAAIHRIPQARRLPEPTLTYGYFIRSAAAGDGSQRHRVGLSQMFPWPTKLTAGADAASIMARSEQRRFEAAALTLRRRVAETYWRIWLVRRTRELQQDQLEVLAGLSGSTRGRVETSGASLADLLQVDLARSRLDDEVAGLDEAERMVEAEMRALVGAPSNTPIPTTPAAPAAVGLPAETVEALRQAALVHPDIEARALMSESAEARARGARADRAPGFMVGAEWMNMEMADAGPGGANSVMVMIGLSLPLWTNAYRAAEQEARAESLAMRAETLDASYWAEASVEQTLAALRDADRRVRLYRDTLIPQAEAAYGSVIGAYQTGQTTVAAALMIQQDLLDLALGLARARTEHAMAWAHLEDLVGHPVAASEEP